MASFVTLSLRMGLQISLLRVVLLLGHSILVLSSLKLNAVGLGDNFSFLEVSSLVLVEASSYGVRFLIDLILAVVTSVLVTLP
jgi:hypothetical protein